MTDAAEAPRRLSPDQRRAVLAALVGNALEWYDFLLYILMAPYLAHAFFPARNGTVSLLLTVATFGVGFIMRPVGALVLGQYADRHGRRAALSFVILLMTLANATLVLTPGSARIGLLAPTLIVLSRLMQGFSVGGDLGSSATLLIESSPGARRGYFGSWQGATQHLASLAASATATATTFAFGHAALQAGWWRLPFVLGLLVGPVGLYLRRHVREPDSVRALLRPESRPLARLLHHHRGALLAAMALIALSTVATYVLELGMPAYARQTLHLPLHVALAANTLAGLLGLVAGPLAGAVADRFGAARAMLPPALLLAVLVWPGYWLLNHDPTARMLLFVQTGLLTLRSMLTGPLLALVAPLFPTETRASGLSVAYNASVLVFGGFAPLITTAMVAATGNATAPAFYILAAAGMTLAALAGLARRRG